MSCHSADAKEVGNVLAGVKAPAGTAPFFKGMKTGMSRSRVGLMLMLLCLWFTTMARQILLMVILKKNPRDAHRKGESLTLTRELNGNRKRWRLRRKNRLGT